MSKKDSKKTNNSDTCLWKKNIDFINHENQFPYAYTNLIPFPVHSHKLPSIYSLVEQFNRYRLFTYFLFGFDPVLHDVIIVWYTFNVLVVLYIHVYFKNIQ